MNLAKVILAFALVAMTSAPASADPIDKKKSKARNADRRTRVSKTPTRIKHYDFAGDELDGELVRPDGDEITGCRGASFTSLIRLRTSFLPEVIAEGAELVGR